MRDFSIKKVVVPLGQDFSYGDKYSIYILGHIYNEIMFIQKLLVMARPRAESQSSAEQADNVFVSMFFLRLLAGKLFEAGEILKRKEVYNFILTKCWPAVAEEELPRCKEEFSSTLRRINRSKWLNSARNGHAMHYPDMDQCRKAIERLESGNAGYEFFVGDNVGETLFRSSDIMAGASFIFEADDDNWQGGFREILDELSDVAGLLLGVLHDAILAFSVELKDGASGAKAKYSEKVKVKDVKKFEFPESKDIKLPYFLHISNDDR